MKRPLLIFLLAITIFVANAQRRYIDIRRLALKSAKVDTDRLNILMGLSNDFFISNPGSFTAFSTIVKGHGGSIDINTTNGEFTEFKIIIPL